MQKGQIWIIDDDSDDQEMIKEICSDIKVTNELVFIASGAEAMKKLNEATVAPFIILCDVNLPQMNGFELRAEMLNCNSKICESVPFIYWSNTASEAQIQKAYELAAHGFFVKDYSLAELRESFVRILNYWQKSKMPEKQ